MRGTWVSSSISHMHLFRGLRYIITANEAVVMFNHNPLRRL
jgi:hypothetical protein